MVWYFSKFWEIESNGQMCVCIASCKMKLKKLRSCVCVFQVSIEAVRRLDDRLFESYIEKKSDPIVGSLEPGIYAGYFDWKDCLRPAGTASILGFTRVFSLLGLLIH